MFDGNGSHQRCGVAHRRRGASITWVVKIIEPLRERTGWRACRLTHLVMVVAKQFLALPVLLVGEVRPVVLELLCLRLPLLLPPPQLPMIPYLRCPRRGSCRD